jgi:spore maturation protein CgeB
MDNDMNMRFFEAMSIGRPLVSDVVPGQDDLFDGESDYISYEKWEDLDTKIQFLLDHPEYAKKIGEHGAAHIRAEHTYQHRLEKILQVCGFY